MTYQRKGIVPIKKYASFHIKSIKQVELKNIEDHQNASYGKTQQQKQPVIRPKTNMSNRYVYGSVSLSFSPFFYFFFQQKSTIKLFVKVSINFFMLQVKSFFKNSLFICSFIYLIQINFSKLSCFYVIIPQTCFIKSLFF